MTYREVAVIKRCMYVAHNHKHYQFEVKTRSLAWVLTLLASLHICKTLTMNEICVQCTYVRTMYVSN